MERATIRRAAPIPPTEGESEELLRLKRRHLIPCVYHFYQRPMVLERGEGCYLYDTAGRRYLDAYSGVGVVNCGHCHPEIVQRTREQAARLQHTTTIYLTEPMLRLAGELAAFMPGGCNRSFFCTSGSEAVEGALLLARLATGRSDFIALRRSLHGRTHLSAGVTGMEFWRTDPFPPFGIHFVPSPHCGDCPLGLRRPGCGMRCADAVERLLAANPDRIAALIVEPVQGNGGIVPLPPGYLTRLRELLGHYGALLIVDEAQTGFCRTGERFAFQHDGVQPDIVTLCKALGNGLPIAAFIATDAVAAAYTRPGASTFGGNLVCAETARAVLDLLQRQRLEERAALLGERLRRKLLELQRRHPVIREVRGRGLMLGAELNAAGGREPAVVMDALLEALREEGILAGKTGPARNVLTLMPPLVMQPADLEFLNRGLEAAFAALFPAN